MPKAIDIIHRETVKKQVPDFRVGDTLKVHVKVKEGDKTRVQVFEGMCISRKGTSGTKTFSVLKETHGDFVEKVYPVFSPTIEKIQIVKKGTFKKAKLYHLRKRTGF